MAITFTREQFAWIVTQRATYVSPETILADFKRRWKDTACSIEDIAKSDRDKLDADWQGFFDEKREEFLNAPTGDKRVRIGELHRLFVSARDRGAACAQYLEQIAKEQADAYVPKGSIGAKGAAKDASGANQEPITEIRVTYVDPKPPPPDESA